MEIQKAAVAGTLESSDAQVTVEPGAGGIQLELSSSVMNQYGRQIRATVLETLERLGVTDAQVTVVDRGALDCTLKARVGARCSAPCGQSAQNIPLGRCGAMIPRPRPERFRLRRTMMFMGMPRSRA
ncbi:MAG: citrate lyase acyl carrier protein [Oscillospiraceae bacterium]